MSMYGRLAWKLVLVTTIICLGIIELADSYIFMLEDPLFRW